MKHLFNTVILLVCGLVTFFLSSVSLKAQSIEASGLVGKGGTALLAEPLGIDINQPAAKLLILAQSEDNYQFFVDRSVGTPDNFQRIDTVLFTSTYEDPGLEMNTTYFYRLLINSRTQYGDTWYFSNTVRVTTAQVDNVPEAPTGLEAVAVTSSQINLAWDDNSDNESYYVVVRKTGETQKTIGTFENATDFEDTDLYPDSSYTYSVVAYNYKGYSTSSNEVTLKTLPDTGGADLYPPGMDSLTLIVTPLSVSTTATIWLFPLNRLHGVQPWAVERSIGSPDNFQTIDTMEISINSNPYPDQGIELNTTVYYRLRAIDENEPFYSNTTYAETTPVDGIPDAPTNLKAVTVTSNQVLLEWDDNDDEAFYTIHRKRGKVTLIEANTPKNQAQYQDKELLPETTYTYYITAYNYKGHSLASNEVTVTTSGLYTLPDSVFAQWLDANYEGLIVNGNQLVLSRAAEIKSLNISKVYIKDLDGLQYFYYLEEFKSVGQIQRVPDLSGLASLKTFVAENANLSFTHLLALKDLNLDSLSVENTVFSIGMEGEFNHISNAFFINPGGSVTMQSSTLKDIHPQSAFQWYNGLQPIAGQTSESFTLSDFTREDVGYYYAIVTNPLLPNDTLRIGAEYGLLIAVNNLPEWWPENPDIPINIGKDHLLASFDNQYLDESAIEPGDIVGIFYEDESGSLQTRWASIWTGSELTFPTIAPGDADGIDPKTGFVEGEQLRFKMWDPIRERNYDVQPEFAQDGEELNIMSESNYYKDFIRLDTAFETHEFSFSSDGLFHPGLHENEMYNWSWSVVINWKGKDIAPWEAVEGGSENHLIIIPSDVLADIQGQPLEIGDYIGFFFENEAGELLCSDFAQWTGENMVLNPWASNTTPKNGYSEGEVLKVKIWKENSELEYIADSLTFSSVPPLDASGLFMANGLSKLTYIKVNEVHSPHDIIMYPGWNLVSSYQIPHDAQMSEILNSVSPVIVKSDRGDVVYAPQNGINTGIWNYAQGYQVYVLSEDTISISGAIVESGATIDIPLNTYPYFLPYWYESPQPVEQVMSSIDGRFDYVQQIKYNKNDKRFYADNYIPSHIISPAIDQIGQMNAGLAYKVKMNQAAQYVLQDLSAGGSSGAKLAQINRKPQYFVQDIQRSTDNVIVVIPEKALQGVNSLSDGDEIAILSPSGKTMGAGVYSGSGMAITAWDVEGIIQGDQLSFKLWEYETNEVINLGISSETGTSYRPNELIMISEINIPSGHITGPNELKFVVYPNPVRSDLHIQLPFSDVKGGVAKLSDLSGRTIFNQNIDSSSGITQCNIPEIKSGLYILEVQIDRDGEIWKGKQKVIISD